MSWCHTNNLSLNTEKTKELIINPRKRRDKHSPLHIGETQVERVKTFKFLGTYISEDLSWSHNTQHIAKKSQQRLYFLRKLRKFGLSSKLLSNFYRCTVESLLCNSITVWFGNCKVQERKALQRVIKTAQYICGAAFPSLQDIYNTRVTNAAFTPKRTESQFRAGARASSKLVPALPQLRTGWFHTGQSQPWSRREQRHDVTANVSASELGQKHTADIFLYSGWK